MYKGQHDVPGFITLEKIDGVSIPQVGSGGSSSVLLSHKYSEEMWSPVIRIQFQNSQGTQYTCYIAPEFLDTSVHRKTPVGEKPVRFTLFQYPGWVDETKLKYDSVADEDHSDKQVIWPAITQKSPVVKGNADIYSYITIWLSSNPAFY